MRISTELDMKTLQQVGANARERVLSNFEAIDRWGEFVAVIEAAAL
jgi:hypothetical protein